MLPPASAAPDWRNAVAFCWRKQGAAGFLAPVRKLSRIRLSDLKDIDEQKARINANTLNMSFHIKKSSFSNEDFLINHLVA